MWLDDQLIENKLQFQSHNGLILINLYDHDLALDELFQSHNGLILIKTINRTLLEEQLFQSHNGLILISP